MNYVIFNCTCIIAAAIVVAAKMLDMRLHKIQVMLNSHIQEYFIREDGKR